MPNTDNATELTLQLYSVPQRIQSKALDMLQEKVLDGKVMPDGNNPTTFLMEFSATVAAGIVNEVSQSLSSLYPMRAQTAADLYRHMSDYDYVNLFSTPSNSTIELVLDRNYLIKNAVRYGTTDYKKIIIPSYSTFKIGEYAFGIHYPIEIIVREARNNGVIDFDNSIVTTRWDLSVPNPLMAMESNVLNNRTYVRDGITLLCISIPIHQFVMTSHQEDAIASTGFTKRYAYTNKFYAARIFHYFKGEWVEMALTLSDINYDPMIPTAKISALIDINVLQIDIPQVYFTSNLIGSKIRTLVYTTQGALNVDISGYNKDQFTASFTVNDEIVGDDTYSAMLKKLAYCQVLPISNKISSGSDGLTFEELRDRVVHDSTYTLLITPADIINYFKDQGFVAKRYLDNITDRIYLAQRVMTDSADITISAGDQNAVFESKVFRYALNEDTGKIETTNYRTIKHINDKSFMILPTTVYRYQQEINSVVPMDNAWMDAFEDMSPTQKVNLLNSGIYTFTPFHLKLTASNTVPVACYYDLMDPKVMNTTFVAENTNVTSQIATFSSKLQHLDNGTGGYRFIVTLYKTSDMEKVPALASDGLTANIKVVLKTTNSDGQLLYMFGKYAGQYNGKDVFVFEIDTDYLLNESDQIDTGSFKSVNSGLPMATNLNLSQDYELLFFVSRDFIPTVGAMQHVDTSEFPPEITSEVWLATQRVTLKLGEPITMLFTNVSVNVEAQQYQVYPTTVYATYTGPVYARYTRDDIGTSDWQGTVITEENINKYLGTLKYPLVILHDEGEVILAAVYDKVIPQACSILIQDATERWSQKTLYLQPIYTATSASTNVWNSTNSEANETDDSNKYQIQVVDVMKYAIDEVATGGATATSYTDLRMQFRDVEETDADGIVTVVRESYDPYAGKMFVFVQDAAGDITDPENTFGDITAGAGALYRRNTEYTNFDYTQYQYRLEDETEYHALTAEVLEQIYEEIDSGNVSQVGEKYNISQSLLRTLRNQVRTPWIKVLVAANMAAVSDYWENRRIINTTAGELYLIQSHLGTTQTYEVYEALPNPSALADNTMAWVSDVRDRIADAPQRLLGDLDVQESIQVRGALLRIKNKEWEWLVTGPSKQACVALTKSINSLSGIAYYVSEEGVGRYLSLLSFDTRDTFVMDFDECSWSLIDKWPWEITTPWVDLTTCTNTTAFRCNIDTNTSAKIANYGGEVRLDSDGNLVGVITDANGDPVEEDDDYADTRQITYNVRTLQVDYKLTMSDEQQHANYRYDVTDLLRSYFATLSVAKQSLLERTDLYYSPIRTMGYAEFKGTNGELESMSLDITMGFRLYVQEYVTNSNDSKEAILNNILSIVESHVATGSISTVRLGEEIREALSDTVMYVDVTGINGDPLLQTLILNDSDCLCHLASNLVVNDDGTIGVNRGVNVEWVSIV